MNYDKNTGDKTFAIKYGARNTMLFAFLVFFSMFLFVDFSPYIHYFLGLISVWSFVLIFYPRPEYVRKSFPFIVAISLIWGVFYLLFYIL